MRLSIFLRLLLSVQTFLSQNLQAIYAFSPFMLHPLILTLFTNYYTPFTNLLIILTLFTKYDFVLCISIFCTFTVRYLLFGLPWWLSGKEFTCQCRRRGFDTWLGKITWRREQHPSPVFLPGKSHGQTSLAGYSPWGSKRVGQDLVTKQQQLFQRPRKSFTPHL